MMCRSYKTTLAYQILHNQYVELVVKMFTTFHQNFLLSYNLEVLVIPVEHNMYLMNVYHIIARVRCIGI